MQAQHWQNQLAKHRLQKNSHMLNDWGMICKQYDAFEIDFRLLFLLW
jgi:hypothetical protein